MVNAQFDQTVTCYLTGQELTRGTLNNESVSSAPGIIEEPTYVEIIDTTPPSEFGPVDKQRHFGILRNTVTNRFRKLMLIALVNLVVVLFLFVFFLIAHLDKKHDNVLVSSTLHNYVKTTTFPAPTTLTTRTDTTAYSHTFATTTRPFDPIVCSPNQKSTFFYAYSNDLTADQVLNTWKSIYYNSNFFFETYALGRFDVMNNLNEVILTFVSSDSYNEISNVLLSNLPNSTESIKDPSKGSGVFKMIDFFFKKNVTHCGATLFIITKRLPTDAYIDDLVSKLKKYHAHVTFVVSENSLGGLSSEPLYRLASETNGVCIFTEDDNIQNTPFWLPSICPLFLVYSFNANVKNSGYSSLPVFNSPLVGYYHIFMTLQNHGPLDAFRMVHLTWYNAGSSNSGFFEETVASHALSILENSTYSMAGGCLDAVPYDMTFQYEYLGETTETLQIRIYSMKPVDFWVPYDD